MTDAEQKSRPPKAWPKGGDTAEVLAPADVVDLGFLGDLAGFWIRRAQLAVYRSLAKHVGHLDLRPVEVAILFIAGQNPGLTQATLATALNTDPSTVVGLLTHLEARKLISRRRLASDRRFQQVRLTRAGEATSVQLRQLLSDHNAHILHGLKRDEQRQLVNFLKRVVANERCNDE